MSHSLRQGFVLRESATPRGHWLRGRETRVGSNRLSAAWSSGGLERTPPVGRPFGDISAACHTCSCLGHTTRYHFLLCERHTNSSAHLMICKPNLVTGSMRNRKPEHLTGCRPRECEVSCYRHGCDPPEPESLLPGCTTPLTHHRTRPRKVASPLTFHFHFFHHLLCKRGGVNCVV